MCIPLPRRLAPRRFEPPAVSPAPLCRRICRSGSPAAPRIDRPCPGGEKVHAFSDSTFQTAKSVIPGASETSEPGIHSHSLGLWIPGLRLAAHRGMTSLGTAVRIPAAWIAPELLQGVRPRDQRGRRECQVLSRTHSLMCKMEKAHERSHYRRSRSIGIPCAMVLTGYVVLAPVRPAFVSPSLALHRSASLAPAARAPGPHAFAVR
jgi:hypothetical protein